MLVDMVGRVFGRLSVFKFSHKVKGKAYWECVCVCGNITTVIGKSLVSGNTKSCGCLRAGAAMRSGKLSQHLSLHRESKTAMYYKWLCMKRRCLNPHDAAYHNYGGRGITVCDEWLHNYKQFRNDMGLPPFAGASLDRIDNNKGYSKENCRWASAQDQRRNTRVNVNLTLNGVTRCISEWAIVQGMPEGTLRSRIDKGWSVTDALCRPVRFKRK